MIRNYIGWISLALFSGFFLFAGVSKLLDPGSFSISIHAYQLTPPLVSWIAAFWLPWLEVIAAIALWLPKWRSAAVLAFILLIAVFQIALLSAAVRGLDISCGCLGSAMDTSILFAFVRNLGLLALVPLFPRWKGGE